MPRKLSEQEQQAQAAESASLLNRAIAPTKAPAVTLPPIRARGERKVSKQRTLPPKKVRDDLFGITSDDDVDLPPATERPLKSSIDSNPPPSNQAILAGAKALKLPKNHPSLSGPLAPSPLKPRAKKNLNRVLNTGRSRRVYGRLARPNPAFGLDGSAPSKPVDEESGPASPSDQLRRESEAASSEVERTPEKSRGRPSNAAKAAKAAEAARQAQQPELGDDEELGTPDTGKGGLPDKEQPTPKRTPALSRELKALHMTTPQDAVVGTVHDEQESPPGLAPPIELLPQRRSPWKQDAATADAAVVNPTKRPRNSDSAVTNESPRKRTKVAGASGGEVVGPATPTQWDSAQVSPDVHTSKPWKCDGCGRRWKNKNGLKYHKADPLRCTPTNRDRASPERGVDAPAFEDDIEEEAVVNDTPARGEEEVGVQVSQKEVEDEVHDDGSQIVIITQASPEEPIVREEEAETIVTPKRKKKVATNGKGSSHRTAQGTPRKAFKETHDIVEDEDVPKSSEVPLSSRPQTDSQAQNGQEQQAGVANAQGQEEDGENDAPEGLQEDGDPEQEGEDGAGTATARSSDPLFLKHNFYDERGTIHAIYHALKEHYLLVRRNREDLKLRHQIVKDLKRLCIKTVNRLSQETDSAKAEDMLNHAFVEITEVVEEIQNPGPNTKLNFLFRDIFAWGFSALFSVLKVAFRFFDEQTTDADEELPLEALQYLIDFSRLIINLDKAALSWHAKNTSGVGIIKSMRNEVILRLRAVEKALRIARLEQLERIHRLDKERRDNEAHREKKERDTLKQGKLERERKMESKWLNIALARQEAEPNLIRRVRDLAPEPRPMRHQRMGGAELDANGEPFERVQGFMERRSGIPTHLEQENAKIWTPEQKEALLEGLQLAKGLNVFEDIIEHYCRPKHPLWDFTAAEIVRQAWYLKDIMVKADMENEGLAYEEIEDWITGIPEFE